MKLVPLLPLWGEKGLSVRLGVLPLFFLPLVSCMTCWAPAAATRPDRRLSHRGSTPDWLDVAARRGKPQPQKKCLGDLPKLLW